MESLSKKEGENSFQKPGFSSFFEGPKRLKTDPFEVKNAQSTLNGTVLTVLKKFFGLLKRH